MEGQQHVVFHMSCRNQLLSFFLFSVGIWNHGFAVRFPSVPVCTSCQGVVGEQAKSVGQQGSKTQWAVLLSFLCELFGCNYRATWFVAQRP